MPRNPNLLLGLQAFWKLDETSGTRADSTGTYDLSVNSGSLLSSNFNPQFYPTALNGKCAIFDSTNALVRTNDTDFNVGLTDFTCSAWFNFSALTAAISGNFVTVLGKYSNAEGFGQNWVVGARGDGIRIQVQNNAAGTTSNVIQFLNPANPGIMVTIPNTRIMMDRAFEVNQWYHVVVEYKYNTGMKCCLNNGTITTQQWAFQMLPGFMPTSVTRFGIGARVLSSGALQSGFEMPGKVCNVGIWNRLLSDAEVGDLWNGGYGLDYDFSFFT